MTMEALRRVTAVGVLMGAALGFMPADAGAYDTYNTKRGDLVECVRGTAVVTKEGHVKSCRLELNKPYPPTGWPNAVPCRAAEQIVFTATGHLESCVLNGVVNYTPASGSFISCPAGKRATFRSDGTFASCSAP